MCVAILIPKKVSQKQVCGSQESFLGSNAMDPNGPEMKVLFTKNSA